MDGDNMLEPYVIFDASDSTWIVGFINRLHRTIHMASMVIFGHQIWYPLPLVHFEEHNGFHLPYGAGPPGPDPWIEWHAVWYEEDDPDNLNPIFMDFPAIDPPEEIRARLLEPRKQG